MSSSKSYRIRANVGTDEQVINVQLKQEYDLFEILSLKLTQEDAYKLYTSSYGIVVGRVIANEGFGVPNAKVSVFIAINNQDAQDIEKKILYPYRDTTSKNSEGIRYNLLPDESVNDCHQTVGTFPNKRLVLDNNDIIEIYDTYWKYTTSTNQSGDYMIVGVPTGNQNVHLDIDLSDVGMLSQRPRDMVYKGYNINQFESPNQFRTSTNLDSLSQIYSQDFSLYVYPFWGDSEENTISVTRKDMEISYKFEPTCVFLGSVVTDSGGNSIAKNCFSYKNAGTMKRLTTGIGTIEMIRKTQDGSIEEYQVNGNQLIDANGVWCYQIPMNLDYVKTDEYGNIVPSDDPTKGIPTRTSVRFRISVNELGDESMNRKRGKMLIPNNPDITTPDSNIDFEFGTLTKDDSFRDLMWNKVYTIKSYIPRVQNKKKWRTDEFFGVKEINEYGQNSPMPYNNLVIRMNIIFRLLCVFSKILIEIVRVINLVIVSLNTVLATIMQPIGFVKCLITHIWWVIRPKKLKKCAKKFVKSATIGCVVLKGGLCSLVDDDYAPGCVDSAIAYSFEVTKERWEKDLQEDGDWFDLEDGEVPPNLKQSVSHLMPCLENDLAQENGVLKYSFFNDWINGTVYLPLWLRKVTKKKRYLFGLIKKKSKVQFCSFDNNNYKMRIFHPCAVTYKVDTSKPFEDANGVRQYPYTNAVSQGKCGKRCYKVSKMVSSSQGLVKEKQTMLGQNVYYYRPVNSQSGGGIRLFATDIVLLGSLNDCDIDGIPQMYRHLQSTTYNMPSDMVLTDSEVDVTITGDGDDVDFEYEVNTKTDMSGGDWGWKGPDQCGDGTRGGLFLDVGCNQTAMQVKSCVNLQRVCELGVSLDETQYIINRTAINSDGWSGGEKEMPALTLVADGYISKDEISNDDARAMFATLNINNLQTEKDKNTSLLKYKLRYTYPDNFDGSLQAIMKTAQDKCQNRTNGDENIVSEKNNNAFENFSADYYRFRMGNKKPKYYSDNGSEAQFPLYENSFYFYFGLKDGNTALDVFNNQYFAPCNAPKTEPFTIRNIETTPSSFCSQTPDGKIVITMGNIDSPYKAELICTSNGNVDSQVQDELTNSEIVFNGLDNETYSLTITDNNGQFITNVIDLSPIYLSFSLENVDFTKSTVNLSEEFGCDVATYCFLQKMKDKTSNVCQNGDDLGGYLKIDYLYLDNKQVTDITSVLNSKIKITVEQSVGEGIYRAIDFNQYYIVCPNDKSTLYFPVWAANCLYRVTITELCNGRDSLNSVSQSVNISEPGAFTLFVNSNNYDIISDFEIKKEGNSYRLKGWDTLSDKNNGVYKWPQNMSDSEKDAFILSMKSSFYQTCDDGGLRLALTSSGGTPPILYQIDYNPEVYNDETEIVTYEPREIVSGSSVDVLTPTLIPLEEAQATGKSYYSVIRSNGSPYGAVLSAHDVHKVAAFTQNGENGGDSKPLSAVVNNPTNWFPILFIDKALSLNITAWLSTNNLSILSCGDTNYNGFFYGFIYNGLVDGQGNLGTCTYSSDEEENGTNIEFKTLNGEDDLPTQRQIRKQYPLTSRTEYTIDVADAGVSDTTGCEISVPIDNSLTIGVSQNVYDSESGAVDITIISDELCTLISYDDLKIDNNPQSHLSDTSYVYSSGYTNQSLWDKSIIKPVGYENITDITEAYNNNEDDTLLTSYTFHSDNINAIGNKFYNLLLGYYDGVNSRTISSLYNYYPIECEWQKILIKHPVIVSGATVDYTYEYKLKVAIKDNDNQFINNGSFNANISIALTIDGRERVNNVNVNGENGQLVTGSTIENSFVMDDINPQNKNDEATYNGINDIKVELKDCANVTTICKMIHLPDEEITE